MLTADRISALSAEYQGRGGPRRRFTPDTIRKGPAAAARAKRERARAFYADLLPALRALRAAGLTLRQVADALNAEGVPTRRGCRWNASQVLRVLNRAGAGTTPAAGDRSGLRPRCQDPAEGVGLKIPAG